MEVMQLDDRKKQVLHAIVDDYVSTNEPVGSKALIERHDFRVSSATLRNEMAELEKLGLRYRPWQQSSSYRFTFRSGSLSCTWTPEEAEWACDDR